MNGDTSVNQPKAALSAIWTGSVFLLLLGYLLMRQSSSSKQRLPPGPRQLPIIGNMLDFPAYGTQHELHWNNFKRLYGPINLLKVLGQNIIITHDGVKTKELLEKHSAKWADRPRLVFAGEMCGYDRVMLLLRHNDQFRMSRKAVHNQFGSLSTIQRWYSDLDVEVRWNLLRILDRPTNFTQHIRKEVGSVILRIVYGYHVEPHSDDRLVQMIEEVIRNFDVASVPGTWLVDVLPGLRYLPDWLPGMNFKRKAKAWNAKLNTTAEVPFQFTQRQTADGNAPVSLVSELLGKQGSDISAEDIDMIKWAALSMYAAGSDTTVLQMVIFYLAMLRHPEVQQKAQAQIDTVVGKGRLPDLSDRPKLSYIDAVLKESMRWRPIGEILPPHVSTEDDYYEEYFIPKGTMLIANLAGFFHDANFYSDPEKFIPERHLGNNPEPNPLDFTWGFGRRICPGRLLASSHLWLLMARTLAVFDFKPVKGKEPGLEFEFSTTVKPVPFEADIRVRSAEHERLIRDVTTTNPFPAHGDGGLLLL